MHRRLLLVSMTRTKDARYSDIQNEIEKNCTMVY